MSLIAFLDRYSFRNPKRKLSEKGGSAMQPHTSRFSKVRRIWEQGERGKRKGERGKEKGEKGKGKRKNRAE